jgi:hypothetical protein
MPRKFVVYRINQDCDVVFMELNKDDNFCRWWHDAIDATHFEDRLEAEEWADESGYDCWVTEVESHQEVYV